MAIWTVTNSTELANAIAKAAGGDEIKVAAGTYAALSVRYRAFESPIKITALDPADPPVFNKASFFQSSGVVLDGLKFQLLATATSTNSTPAILIDQSSKISVINSKITGALAINGVEQTATTTDATGNVIGLPFGRGISVNKSSDITIASNDISVVGKGLVLTSADGVVIDNNEIHDLRTSPIVGTDLDNITITRNYTYNYTPWRWNQDGDHGDLIHFWTDATRQTSPSTNIVIKDNFLTQGTGVALLGIFFEANHPTYGFEQVVIENNVIANSNNQAIRLSRTTGVVANNTAVQTDGTMTKSSPGLIAASGSNLIITDNLLGHITIYSDSTAQTSGNTLITHLDPNAAGYYSKVLLNPFAVPPKLDDLAKLDGIMAGATLTSAGVLPWETAVSTVDTSTVTAPTTEVVAMPADATLETSQPTTNTVTISPEPDPAPAPAPVELVMTGTGGADQLTDNGLAATLVGLAGDDVYFVGHSDTKVVETAGGGTDTVNASVDFFLSADLENLNLEGSAVNGTGNALANTIRSGDGNQVLNGLDGNDTLNAGGDADTLYGGNGNDSLTGGAGNDKLYGGAGKDGFVFTQDSVTAKDFDEIFDFVSRQDRIDLRSIDANSNTARNDSFTPIWGAEFSRKAGELQIKAYSGGMLIAGDVNGDGVADFSIMVHNVAKLQSTDFSF